jgi:hypothetical protein
MGSIKRDRGRGATTRVSVVLGAVLLLGLLAGPATAGAVPLELWPAGAGRIEVRQGGAPPSTCSYVEDDATRPGAVTPRQAACLVDVAAGTPVTVTAIPGPLSSDPSLDDLFPDFPPVSSAFVRWSRVGCSGSSCTFTPDPGGEWVTAEFTPLQLEIALVGGGTVSARADGAPLTLSCSPPPAAGFFGDVTCHALVAAGAKVELTASSGSAWGPECEPSSGAATCIVSMTNTATFARVAFGGAALPDLPFKISPTIRVLRAGTGEGRVTGSGIDCGTKCSELFDFQAHVKLAADPSPGSTFTRWEGVCSSSPSCEFSAGSATVVRAVFDVPQRPTAPGKPSDKRPKKPANKRPRKPADKAAKKRTDDRTAGRVRELGARFARVTVRGHGSRRTVTASIVVARASRARARLMRRAKTVAARGFALRRGRNTLRLRVPRSAKPGVYRLSLRIAAGREHGTLNRAVRIGG